MTAQSATVMRLFSDMSFARKAGVIVAFAVILRLVFFSGISASDDVFVAQAALRLLEDGPYLPTSHYTGRLMLIYPQAAIFAAFGVGGWQMAIIPLFSSISALCLAGALARRFFGGTAALWTLVAGAIFPLDIYYSTQLFPDVPLGAMLGAAIYCAVRSVDGPGRAMIWAILAGLCWGGAYLIRVEAAFLLFPMAAVYWSYGRNWRMAFVTAAACGVIVVGENLIYWALTGDVLYRLKIINESATALMTDEHSARQLWIFPKAWFLTAYQFSLHYYLLFAAMIIALWRRDRGVMLCVIWAAAFLLWLQFGTNPFDDVIRFKSHLQRYCLMLSVPTFMLIGHVIASWHRTQPRAVRAFSLCWILGSLFLASFNILSAERDTASKQALATWAHSRDLPVYMDAGSYTLASFLYRDDVWRGQFQKLVEHDYYTGANDPIDPALINGFILLNSESFRFTANRYGVGGFDLDRAMAHCAVVSTVDNPSPAVAYAAARLLGKLGNLVPVTSLREKISGTTSALLAEKDVVVMACGTAREPHRNSTRHPTGS